MSKAVDYEVITHRALNGLIEKIKGMLKADVGWNTTGGISYHEIPEKDKKGFYAQAMVKKEGT